MHTSDYNRQFSSLFSSGLGVGASCVFSPQLQLRDDSLQRVVLCQHGGQCGEHQEYFSDF
jgi:hypothetical protein